jgi:hypothetical protein
MQDSGVSEGQAPNGTPESQWTNVCARTAQEYGQKHHIALIRWADDADGSTGARTPRNCAMDGFSTPTPHGATRLLLAVALATLAALASLGIAGPARADDAPVTAPATRWPIGGTAIRTAMSLGAERWGFSPCRGRVAVAWAPLGAGLNAESSWSNDADPFLQASRNGDCEITLSLRDDWDWPKLCTVLVHEVGHLAGHDHVDDPDDVMYPTYMHPVPECLATPEPVEAAQPSARPAPPKASAATPRRATKPKARAKAQSKHPRRGR